MCPTAQSRSLTLSSEVRIFCKQTTTDVSEVLPIKVRLQ
jgi:hypothetical protein